MVKVTRLRFEQYDGGCLGTGEASPRISWSFEGDDSSWLQQSYELALRRRDSRVEHFRVSSSQSLLVPWPGSALVTGESAQVRVRVSGRCGNTSEWSDWANIEAGLLSKEDWACQLIESNASSDETSPRRPVVFRRCFQIKTGIDRARLYVTAHGIYAAKINGTVVGDHVLSPGWTSYGHRLVYQTFDVTSLLQYGNNLLEVTVAEGWFCGKLGDREGRENVYGDALGLIAQLTFQLGGGTISGVGTDRDWQWSHGPCLTAGLYDGVHYDGGEKISERTEWQTVICKPIEDNIVASLGPPIRRQQEIAPKEIIVTPSGKTLLDMGQNMVGWVKVLADGPAGTRITLRYAEVLEHDELGTRPLRTAKATDVLVLGGNGPFEWEPVFTYHGFRYVEVDGWPGKLEKASITGIVIHSDMRPTGSFSCSNRMLNKLHDNVIWSMRGNFVGLPTDCPQRDERLGWTGDINVFGSTANFLYDTSGLLQSWLADLRMEQAAVDGVVPLVVPNIFAKYEKDCHALWGDVAIMLPWSLYLAFGDLKILQNQFDSMRDWLRAIPRRGNGLWDYAAEWKLADWLDPAAPPIDPGMARTDPTHVSDAFLVHVTTLMSLISGQLGDRKASDEYSADAAKLRKAYVAEYVTPSGLLADNTQTAYSLALHFELIPSVVQQERAAEHLKLNIRRNSRFKIATGFAGTPFIGHALTKAGRSNIFYRMLLGCKCPSWLYPVSMGATTIWERWDSMLSDGSINPGQMTSFNHYALGSVADWMHSHILGLQIKEPGWREFIVKPVPGGGLTWAQGEHLSPYGRISARWRITEGQVFRLELVVPPNTLAHVRLHGRDSQTSNAPVVCGSGKHVWEVPFVAAEWPPEAIVAPFTDEDDESPTLFDEASPCPWI